MLHLGTDLTVPVEVSDLHLGMIPIAQGDPKHIEAAPLRAIRIKDLRLQVPVDQVATLEVVAADLEAQEIMYVVQGAAAPELQAM
ncbi:MAG: hypothetical protein ACJAUO_000921 [Sediminicola sp.]|jgi:hypothetical protein